MIIRLKNLIKRIVNPRFRELYRLYALPRYTRTSTTLIDGVEFKLVDGPSFAHTYRSIIEEGMYEFQSDREHPLILDCGANVGTSVLYFKQLYPGAHIIAFEPDVNVFNVLSQNINERDIDGVELINAAVWKEEGELNFIAEGADSGRIDTADRGEMKVPTVRLSDYIAGRKISMLKMDIEGAELEVLNDCRNVLMEVENIFVEYHSFSGKDQGLSSLLGVLEAAGFRYYVESESAKVAQPFLAKDSHDTFDFQLNIFAYRVPKRSTSK